MHARPTLAAIGLLVLVMPLFLAPSAGANASEIDKLKLEYWKVAADVSQYDSDHPTFGSTPVYARSFSEQQELRKKIHMLGHHIDDGHEPCEWSGYVGAWRILLGRLGLA